LVIKHEGFIFLDRRFCAVVAAITLLSTGIITLCYSALSPKFYTIHRTCVPSPLWKTAVSQQWS